MAIGTDRHFKQWDTTEGNYVPGPYAPAQTFYGENYASLAAAVAAIGSVVICDLVISTKDYDDGDYIVVPTNIHLRWVGEGSLKLSSP